MTRGRPTKFTHTEADIKKALEIFHRLKKTMESKDIAKKIKVTPSELTRLNQEGETSSRTINGLLKFDRHKSAAKGKKK